jgi:hypothetical protein
MERLAKLESALHHQPALMTFSGKRCGRINAGCWLMGLSAAIMELMKH